MVYYNIIDNFLDSLVDNQIFECLLNTVDCLDSLLGSFVDRLVDSVFKRLGKS